MKMYKDLRGVMMSCNNSRSYNIVYEALYVRLTQQLHYHMIASITLFMILLN